SLSVGEGGRGLGHPARDTGTGVDAIVQRVPHNSPDLFNRGLLEINVLFNDGRIFPDSNFASGFNSPAGHQLPVGLDSILAAQNILPLTNVTEMAGQAGENDVADAAVNEIFEGPNGVWELLLIRLRGIPEYASLFQAAFDDVNSAADMNITHVGNAIAAYIGTSFRADNSPFDRFLRGDKRAMSVTAQEGMRLFYDGNAKNLGGMTCGSCHSGTLQTDQDFHAIAMPQIGPGKGDGVNGREDFGHFRVSGDENDLYKFRTPSLRNVVLTAPYGHTGSFDTLRKVVDHHVNAIYSLYNYDTSQAQMPSRSDLDAIDFEVMENPYLVDKIAEASEIKKLKYSKKDIDKIMEFLYALTDPASLDIRDKAPRTVPSELPLAD
ncbi:cytochrome-c peroxidase, partial [Photobacterium sanctipauli]